MRPSIVITIAVLLIAILGAAALQFFILAPGDSSVDGELGVGGPQPAALTTFVHL